MVRSRKESEILSEMPPISQTLFQEIPQTYHCMNEEEKEIERIEDLLDNAVRWKEIELTWTQIQDIARIIAAPTKQPTIGIWK